MSNQVESDIYCCVSNKYGVDRHIYVCVYWKYQQVTFKGTAQ